LSNNKKTKKEKTNLEMDETQQFVHTHTVVTMQDKQHRRRRMLRLSSTPAQLTQVDIEKTMKTKKEKKENAILNPISNERDEKKKEKLRKCNLGSNPILRWMELNNTGRKELKRKRKTTSLKKNSK
jgi:hypothetical protein